MSKEAIEKLTKNVVFWDNEGSGRIAELPRDDYDQALALLKEQPPASDFREIVSNRLPVILPDSYEGMKSLCAKLSDTINEACDRLDQQSAQLKAKDELLFAYESVRSPKQLPASDFTKNIRHNLKVQGRAGDIHRFGNTYAELLKEACDHLDRSEASRKELLTACRQAFNESHNPEVEKILKVAIKANKEISGKK